MALQPGTHAPDFTLKSHTGEEVSLAARRGSWTIVAFHPATFTGG